MRYAFAIDHRKCIGCHACTVACKTEHGVPLGEYRTWVKYVERGEFPNVRRYFTVLRCNHCTDAPCVTICPTAALYQRNDGVVDFNKDRCIGCKSCMQACPYDALYIDSATNTAAKCNFCAHRLEVGLEPACVIVCPEQAIIAGDLDNPLSIISKLVNREPTEVRKPEQGTGPNVYYIGADSASLSPTAIARGQTYLWAQPKVDAREKWNRFLGDIENTLAEEEASALTPSAAKATPEGHRIQSLGQVTYDVHHPAPWGWKVAAYLWTKGIAAGALLIPGLLVALGLADQNSILGIGAPSIALIFNAATVGLLIADLKRPDRFHYILTKGNGDSWLVRGAYILMAHGAVSALWLLSSWLGQEFVLRLLAWPAVLVALATAGYTALLFGQCEGRDLWQSPLVLWHLLLQAALAGAGALLLPAVLSGSGRGMVGTLAGVLTCAVALNGLLLAGENLSKPTNRDVALAGEMIWRGRYAPAFVCGAFGLSVVLPILVLVGFQAWTGASPGVAAAAAVMVLVGLLIHEVIFVKAGQAVPLS
jgi:Fe-S-cluster-containing dehydrogenase component/formate-dependent nitrite reductase membrane component NrfD